MKTLRGSLAFALVVAMSMATSLDAQRGGGRGGGRGSGSMPGGGRGNGPGGGRGNGPGAGRGGERSGGRGNNGSSASFFAAFGVPTRPLPSNGTQGLSVDHPLPGNLNTVHPAPVIGFGPPPPTPFAARRGTYTRQHAPGSYGSWTGYGFSTTDDGSYVPQEPRPDPIEEENGMLFLDVTPSSAQVFVDNAFVGSVDDLRARGVRLSPRHHWIDLEAAGYEKKTFEVTLPVGEPVRYRADLSPTRSARLVVPPRAAQTMYAIPGCYGGNLPPVAANLPQGCDIAKVRVIRPQASARIQQ